MGMSEEKKDKGAPDDGIWARGCERPLTEGVYEVEHMGRMILVRARKDHLGEMRIYGVPGHMNEGIHWKEFDLYRHPRHNVGRRSEASNLSLYDRIASRALAALVLLMEFEKKDTLVVSGEKLEDEALRVMRGQAIEKLREGLYKAVRDETRVRMAVKERLDLWYREDASSLPLPNRGLGAPVEGEDINGNPTTASLQG